MFNETVDDAVKASDLYTEYVEGSNTLANFKHYFYMALEDILSLPTWNRTMRVSAGYSHPAVSL